MDLYLAGAENPTYLRKLCKLGVTKIAISYLEWQRRFASDDLYKRLPSEMEVCITSGVSRKNEDASWWGTFSKDYMDFCEKNAEQALIYDMDAANCPSKIRQATRDMLSILPNVVVFPIGGEDLTQLAKTHERIGVNATLAKSLPAVELRRIHAALYGSNIADAKTLRIARFNATTTLAWLSGRRYGELWVFARNKMHHYTAENLKRAVRAHEHDLIALGVDPVKCAENNPDALTVAAVRSLQALVNSFSKRPRDRHVTEIAATSSESDEDEVLTNGALVPAQLVTENGVRPLNNRVRTIMPGITMNDQEDGAILMRTPDSLRQCNSCSIADSCPKYEKDTSCAFSFPAQMTNVNQWEAASQIILEMQMERVTFARLAEQIDGDVLNPRVGQEMDRMLKLMNNIKDLKTPIVTPGGGVFARAFAAMATLGEGSASQEENDDEDEDADPFQGGDEEDEYEDAESVDV